MGSPVIRNGVPLVVDGVPCVVDDPCDPCSGGGEHDYCPCSCSEFIDQASEAYITISGHVDSNTGLGACGEVRITNGTLLNGTWGGTLDGSNSFETFFGTLGVEGGPLYDVTCSSSSPSKVERRYLYSAAGGVICGPEVSVGFLFQLFRDGVFIGLTSAGVGTHFSFASWEEICSGPGGDVVIPPFGSGIVTSGLIKCPDCVCI